MVGLELSLEPELGQETGKDDDATTEHLKGRNAKRGYWQMAQRLYTGVCEV